MEFFFANFGLLRSRRSPHHWRGALRGLNLAVWTNWRKIEGNRLIDQKKRSEKNLREGEAVFRLHWRSAAVGQPWGSSPSLCEGKFVPETPGHITELLQLWKQGDDAALHALVPLLYKELRKLAHYYLRSERADHTLQSTELVHEAYLRLVGKEAIPQNRAHFMAVACWLIRQVLVDYARARNASKRDGGIRITLDPVGAPAISRDAELIALDTALNDLSRIDQRQAKIVEMKFFGGLSAPEISEVLGISRATVDRDWATARVWLHRQMNRKSQV